MNIEQAKELRQSILWEEVTRELDGYIRSEEAKLRTCSIEDLRAVQRAIQTLEMIKRLPENVIGREE